MRKPSTADQSFLKYTLYGQYGFMVLLSVLNSLHARDEDARAIVMSLRSGGLSKAKKLYESICWQSDKPKSLKKINTRRDTIKNALQQWLTSHEPERLRECNRCKSFFFDRSRSNSEQQCDGCREELITEARSPDQVTPPNIPLRKLPPIEELEGLLSLGHGSEPPHRIVTKYLANGDKEYAVNDYLVNSCKECVQLPRTFLMTFWWVQSLYPFWKDLVDDLPDTLRDMFNARWMKSSKALTERRHAALALAWCIREADHYQSLSQKSFAQQMEQWIVELQISKCSFLDITYLPPYDLSFLQKISETRHQSSRRRKHASDYWGRGGITRSAGSVRSQGFWTACAGPLAVRLRPHAKGKTWDEKQAVPRALWKEILKLWSLRYPERELPSPDALRRRVTQGFAV